MQSATASSIWNGRFSFLDVVESESVTCARVQELEARIERLEREKSILKKATALLMSEGIERTR